MKIRPVILCGGEGTRLWPKSKKNQAKQFINFGGWSLIEKTLYRTKGKIFDSPIISTNLKYLKQVKYFLKKIKINRYKIVLEPAKKNTAPAILAAALIKNISNRQPLMFFPADHLIENINMFNILIFFMDVFKCPICNESHKTLIRYSNCVCNNCFRLINFFIIFKTVI